ncbi:hypothetical protein RJT34_32161 [Clitoria ternatea]|uniref:Uncharacterized protein n=1 Tax=Clitoria ternatea TaxID=43366 RepID=A0AAN9EVW5_CLITE
MQQLVARDCIERAVRKLMDGGDEIRRRAKHFWKKAKEALEEGGSSYNNLTALIHYLKQLRDSNASTFSCEPLLMTCGGSGSRPHLVEILAFDILIVWWFRILHS